MAILWRLTAVTNKIPTPDTAHALDVDTICLWIYFIKHFKCRTKVRYKMSKLPYSVSDVNHRTTTVEKMHARGLSMIVGNDYVSTIISIARVVSNVVVVVVVVVSGGRSDVNYHTTRATRSRFLFRVLAPVPPLSAVVTRRSHPPPSASWGCRRPRRTPPQWSSSEWYVTGGIYYDIFIIITVIILCVNSCEVKVAQCVDQRMCF